MKHTIRISFFLFFLLLLSFEIFAQNTQKTPLTLANAIKQATENNLSLKAANLNIEYQKQLQKTAVDIPKTDFTLTYGQYNSFVLDNGLAFSQKIPYPNTFSKQRKLAEANTQTADFQQKITKNELVYQVKMAYNFALFTKAQNTLFLYQDTIINNFLKMSELRFKTGETNSLEKNIAKSQSLEVKNLLLINENDQKTAKIKLQTLLNTNLNSNDNLELAEKLAKRDFTVNFDTTKINENPVLKAFKHQIDISKLTQSVEKSRLLPDFSIGAFSQTLTGYQQKENRTETYYGTNTRFNGVVVGISIPIFAKAQKARFRATKVQQQLAQANYDYQKRTLQGQYAQTVQEFVKFQSNLAYYEQTALPMSADIIKTSEKLFKSGSIGYLEYLAGFNNAISIQKNYLDALYQYNQQIFLIEFLLSE